MPQKTRINHAIRRKCVSLQLKKHIIMSYYKRTADALLQDLLDAFGAVLIEGPKWCGKTTTASQLANRADASKLFG